MTGIVHRPEANISLSSCGERETNVTIFIFKEASERVCERWQRFEGERCSLVVSKKPFLRSTLPDPQNVPLSVISDRKCSNPQCTEKTKNEDRPVLAAFQLPLSYLFSSPDVSAPYCAC